MEAYCHCFVQALNPLSLGSLQEQSVLNILVFALHNDITLGHSTEHLELKLEESKNKGNVAFPCKLVNCMYIHFD